MDNLLIFLLFKDYQENFRKNIINIKFMNFSKIFAYKKPLTLEIQFSSFLYIY